MKVERRVRKYQLPFHRTWVTGEKKRLIEIAHRRWGKDEIALMAASELAHKRVGSYWHCLPEYSQARKAIWTAVNPHTGKRRIDEAFPLGVCQTRNEQEMFVRFKNGSTWQLVGSDNYNSLVGAGVAGVTFSEWALCNPSAWGYIRPMIEENNGWAAFITTPRGRNHAKSMYDMAKTNPNWFAEISSVTDTKALTQEQLDEGLAEYISLYGEDIGRSQFDQEYYCSFNASIMGAFYAREMLAVRNEGRIDELEPIDGLPVHTAWDLGVSDSTAIWWFQVVGSQIFILDFYRAHSADIEHYAEICHAKGWVKGNDYVPHDARQRLWGMKRGRVEQMQDCGLRPVVLPLNGKMDGIAGVRHTLPLCVFSNRCEVEGIPSLEQYRREWDDDLKTFRMNEVHDWACHGADAFRYLAQAWRAAPRQAENKKPEIPKGAIMLPGPPKPSTSVRIRL